MRVTRKIPDKISIIRLSNKDQVKNISPGLYYYYDFSTKEIYYYDYRKVKFEKRFKDFNEFDNFLAKEFD